MTRRRFFAALAGAVAVLPFVRAKREPTPVPVRLPSRGAESDIVFQTMTETRRDGSVRLYEWREKEPGLCKKRYGWVETGRIPPGECRTV